MTYTSQKVSNGSINQYSAAVDRISNVEYQAVKLIDPTQNSTSPIGVAANPLQVGSATLATETTVSDISSYASELAALVIGDGNTVTWGVPTMLNNGGTGKPWAGDTNGRGQVYQPNMTQSSTLDMTNASATAVFACDGLASVAVQFNRGSETGNVQFDATADGTNWVKINELFYKGASGGPLEINAEANNASPAVSSINSKIYLLSVAGKKQIRVAVQTTGAGTALPITFRGSAFPNGLIENVRPGTSANSLGKSEDAAASSGDVGVFMLAVRRDTPTVSSGTAGDYSEVNVSAQGALWSSLTPSVGGGWSTSYQSALTNTKVQIKGAAGTFGGSLDLFNTNAAVVYIQVFDALSASVTLGTTAPTYVIPLASNEHLPGREIANGIAHATGITIACTTTASGSTAPASAIIGTFLYK